ncbi:ABC transporter substrate-binding protein [Paractinoplanes abujensis]|uniref:Iron complex transport system substrate-binding protein n=1 Tax=Paractinoplanes abujensis TaxID=882441 RepID=A0A7W7G1B6_9ACTN|nr:iron-siderophore ABC transporter substrate-binding protein [Actinoplanes abujensis]MBB4691990.1 iron complex transport system substrate-binding protein [Actinoplanes abujensis]GID16592.1 ABC transporter substrate-binding protein [Actinoplanes abujensis]
MVITRRAFATGTAAALTAVLLAACGTTEEPADEAAAAPAPSSGPVELTDERGTVKLDAPAKNVVSLEWGLTENLVALGVKPVGQADVKGYNAWDKSAPIDASTPDVGTRGEPSLDAIAALKPDLVVTVTDLPENVIAQIAKTAPVLALRGSDGSDPIGYMRKTVTTLARATGTTPQGEKLLADFDAKVTAGKDALAKAGKTGAPFVMTDGWVESGNVSLRMYTPTSFFGGIAKELGLTNQWPDGGDKDYGLAQNDVEGLTKIKDAGTTYIYVANDADGGNFTDSLKDNAVWKQLPFVKAGNVKRIPDGIWMFGGPASANAYIDALTAALTA